MNGTTSSILELLTEASTQPSTGEEDDFTSENHVSEVEDEATGNVVIVIQLVMGLVILVLNAITFRVIQRRGVRLFDGARILLGNLALADVVYGASIVVRFFVYMFPSSFWYVCSGPLIGIISSSASSSTFILLLCLQNYVSIKHPFMLKRFFKFRYMIMVSVVVWLFWTLIGALIFSLKLENFKNGMCRLGDGHPDVLFFGFSMVLLQAGIFLLIQVVTLRHLVQDMRNVSPMGGVRFENSPSTSGSGRQQQVKELQQEQEEQPRQANLLSIPSRPQVSQFWING